MGIDHQMQNCPLRLKFEQLLASEKQGTNTVGVNSVELQKLDDPEVAAIVMRVARGRAGIPLVDKELKELEPRQPKIQADWQKEERLWNEFIAFTEEIDRENELARQAEEELQRANKADLEANTLEGPTLDKDWVGFSDPDSL